METVILTSTWTCPDGHKHSISQDLGDPADNVLVERFRDDIHFGGCKEKIGSKRCGKNCTRTTSEKTVYG